jgi:hypothetical protein
MRTVETSAPIGNSAALLGANLGVCTALTLVIAYGAYALRSMHDDGPLPPSRGGLVGDLAITLVLVVWAGMAGAIVGVSTWASCYALQLLKGCLAVRPVAAIVAHCSYGYIYASASAVVLPCIITVRMLMRWNDPLAPEKSGLDLLDVSCFLWVILVGTLFATRTFVYVRRHL